MRQKPLRRSATGRVSYRRGPPRLKSALPADRWLELCEKHSAACRRLNQIRNDTSNISTGRNEDDALDGFNVRAARFEPRFSIQVCCYSTSLQFDSPNPS